MDIKTKYKKIFFDLFKNDNGLLAYSLYSRYNIQPSEIVDFIDEYLKNKIISIDEDQRIKLTLEGRNKINIILDGLKTQTNEEITYDELISSNYRIEPFEPYLPDKSFYENYLKERRDK